ncbi:MAG TPA: hypothetical protein DCZ72_07885 [Armatimonadetes bacterium]|mgnify:CR=1 FL=1|nr:hypothetical protein [Armatimonadota bacterium]
MIDKIRRRQRLRVLWTGGLILLVLVGLGWRVAAARRAEARAYSSAIRPVDTRDLPLVGLPPRNLRNYREFPPYALGLANPVYITRAGTRYHRADCEHLRHGATDLPRKDAQRRGFTRCADCQP